MNDMPEDPLDRALMLKGMTESAATGGDLPENLYRGLRSEFMNDAALNRILPQFVRTCLDHKALWGHMSAVHSGSGAYAARRNHINEEFQPLLNHLLDKGAPADADVSEALSRYDGKGVEDAWHKALSRRKSDPEGAITSARTLLEEVCKHILEDAGQTPQGKWDLPKLYSEATKLMNLSPSQHTEDTFKRILGACQSVVENLGGLRNKISDAHGGGRLRVRPSERHAALAVNLAGSMAMFLIETWAVQQAKEAAQTAHREPHQSPVVYKGVQLVSRQNLAHEIEDMKRIVDALTPDNAGRIEEVWCDSKATATYSISIRDGLWEPDMQWAINSAIYNACGGHNGVYFQSGAPVGIDLDPYWPDMDG